MPIAYDAIPDATRARLLAAGRGLGTLEEILDDKVDPDADAQETVGLIAGAVGLVLCLSLPVMGRLLGWIVLGQFAGYVLVLIGLTQLVRRLRRRARNRRRRYVGLFADGIAEVRLGSDETHVVRFAGATADVHSAWSRKPKGRRAQHCTLTLRGPSDAVTFVAANDAAYFGLNAILRHVPGARPVLRDKEPRYEGD